MEAGENIVFKKQNQLGGVVLEEQKIQTVSVRVSTYTLPAALAITFLHDPGAFLHIQKPAWIGIY